MDEFIANLFRLAKNLGYGTLHDKLVRDRIFVGIKDGKLSEKLQLEANLTIDSCITKVWQSESVKKQQGVVKGDRDDKMTVEAVITSKHRQIRKTTGSAPKPPSCSKCGRSLPHPIQQCLANQATCLRCHKKGHYKHCCKSKGGIREVRQEDSNDLISDSGDEFLGTVNADTVNTSKPWTAVVRLNERDLEFKLTQVLMSQ